MGRTGDLTIGGANSLFGHLFAAPSPLWFLPMKSSLSLAIACAVFCASPAFAAERRVLRIDGLLASRKNGVILLQAKGAVQSGGWTRPRLHVMHGDGRTITVEFLATPPPSGMTVIDALVPVTADARVRGRASSVHVLADQNEITSQVLK
jgi:hypothetical protein